ncbi:exonuclease [Aquisalimonas sp.]|uniref:exonuclease n=1 Tax=unclassified Aquisalimonas TaxID=2644645 RepID=UPI0025C0A939|nr:exonuclease [Aquisalimonas sp.]
MSRFRKPPNDVFVSTDIEADGPVPGLYSMLSIGSAAYSLEGELLDTFSVNLETLPEAGTHPDTMTWWEQWPEAWAACRQDQQPPEQGMQAYRSWLEGMGGRPVFVAWPVAFDFTFVNYYLHRFTGGTPFGYTALDIKSYAMAVIQTSSFHRATKKRLPAHLFEPGLRHNHIALDDALEQGSLFLAILQENLSRGMPDVNPADYTEYPDWNGN